MIHGAEANSRDNDFGTLSLRLAAVMLPHSTIRTK